LTFESSDHNLSATLEWTKNHTLRPLAQKRLCTSGLHGRFLYDVSSKKTTCVWHSVFTFNVITI